MADNRPGPDKPIPGFFAGTSMPTDGWWSSLWPDPAAVARAIGVGPGMRVIDLCCGDGWFSLPMAELAGETIAIDIDPTMTAALRDRLADGPAVTVLTGDACDVDALVGPPADFVLLANAFHGVPDRSRLVSSIGRALLPGGRLAIINWHRRPREETTIDGVPRGPASEQRMSPAETVAAVAAGPFAHERTLDLPPYHYAALFRRAE